MDSIATDMHSIATDMHSIATYMHSIATDMHSITTESAPEINQSQKLEVSITADLTLLFSLEQEAVELESSRCCLTFLTSPRTTSTLQPFSSEGCMISSRGRGTGKLGPTSSRLSAAMLLTALSSLLIPKRRNFLSEKRPRPWDGFVFCCSGGVTTGVVVDKLSTDSERDLLGAGSGKGAGLEPIPLGEWLTTSARSLGLQDEARSRFSLSPATGEGDLVRLTEGF
jgi:hypothetical protein